ncbi:MAG: hypothetical protein GY725_02045 [bacterium]|nr:hypothetical protein [bacterium]
MSLRKIKGKGWSVLAASAVLCIAGIASAVLIEGRGELAAAGDGLAVVTMRGVANIAGLGIAIVPERKIEELDGQGRVTPLDGGRVLLEGFGRVVLASPNEVMRFKAAGARLRLRARGAGVARLKGHGRIWTDDADAPWNPDVDVEFSDPSTD